MSKLRPVASEALEQGFRPPVVLKLADEQYWLCWPRQVAGEWLWELTTGPFGFTRVLFDINVICVQFNWVGSLEITDEQYDVCWTRYVAEMI